MAISKERLVLKKTRSYRGKTPPAALRSNVTRSAEPVVAKTRVDILAALSGAISSGSYPQMVHRLKGLERISVIQAGVQAKTFRGLASDVDLPVAALSKSLGLAPSTMRRKAKEGEKLSTADSERVLGFVSLIGQVDEMLGEDRPANFDAAKWLTQWIQEPHPALGGRKPDEMLNTTTGQSLVSDLLASTASGSYW